MKLPRGGGLASRLITKVFEITPFLELAISGINEEEIPFYFYNIVRKKFESKGLDISRCQSNRIGNPSGVCEINGEIWTLNQLQACSVLIEAMDHINIPEDGIICELGPGMGRNVEIIASLCPNATFLIFDIPPQVYVVNQYMKKRFPDRVVPYEAAMNIKPAESSKIADSLKGKIIVMPALKMAEWSSIDIDLFWNVASFQEMETNVISNYLTLVKKMNAKTVFIDNYPGGNYGGKWSPGKGGIKEKLPVSIYVNELEDKYNLKAEYFSNCFNEQQGPITQIFQRL